LLPPYVKVSFETYGKVRLGVRRLRSTWKKTTEPGVEAKTKRPPNPELTRKGSQPVFELNMSLCKAKKPVYRKCQIRNKKVSLLFLTRSVKWGRWR
jgi:hypothetical protein